MRPRTGWETQAAPPQAPAPNPALQEPPFGGTGSPGHQEEKGAPSPTAAIVASLPKARGGSGAALKGRRAPGVHSAVFGWLQ